MDECFEAIADFLLARGLLAARTAESVAMEICAEFLQHEPVERLNAVMPLLVRAIEDRIRAQREKYLN